MKTSVLLALPVALALAGCVAGGERSAAGPPEKLFRGVPFPQEAHVVDTATTAEAVRAVLSVDAPPQVVLAFYRRELPKAGFRIIGDVGDTVEADLYAQRDGPPLWVQVRRGPQPGTARFTLIGAVGGERVRNDSAAAAKAGTPAPR